MAIIWTKTVNDKTYEVRTAGNSIRLYTNNVFHSQYNPQQPFSGQVWDLLSLPSLFFPLDNKPKRILVLGVGGGAAIKQLAYLNEPEQIKGIELDKTHISIAKRFFNVASTRTTHLVHQSAWEWVRNYRGEKFDYIVDDLFTDEDNQPQRAITANSSWIKKLNKLRAENGVIVINFADEKELSQCGIFSDNKLNKIFTSCFKLDAPHTHNRIGVFSSQTITTKDLKKNIVFESKRKKHFPLKKLRFNVKKCNYSV